MSVILLKNRTLSGDKYEDLLVRVGLRVCFVPLIEHEYLSHDAIELFQKCNTDTILVVTSQRAVECLEYEVLPCLGDEARTKWLQEALMYAVGPATQQYLQKCGFRNVRGGAETGNGASLAQFIISDITPGRPVTMLVGETRRDIIPVKLRENGFRVNDLITYRTRTCEDNSFRLGQAMDEAESSWIVVFSPQGTLELIDRLKSSSKVISIGPTTTSYLSEHKVEVAFTCAHPDPESLLSGLQEYL